MGLFDIIGLLGIKSCVCMCVCVCVGVDVFKLGLPFAHYIPGAVTFLKGIKISKVYSSFLNPRTAFLT